MGLILICNCVVQDLDDHLMTAGLRIIDDSWRIDHSEQVPVETQSTQCTTQEAQDEPARELVKADHRSSPGGCRGPACHRLGHLGLCPGPS